MTCQRCSRPVDVPGIDVATAGGRTQICAACRIELIARIERAAEGNPLDLENQPLAIDPDAESMVRDSPAFAAPPEGAPVYHGFRVLDDVSVEGFRLGAITDFEAAPSERGDAFIVAPDGGRAGLIWELGGNTRVDMTIPPDPERWGVYQVRFPHPMDSRQNARRNLAAVLPLIRENWRRWRNGEYDPPRGYESELRDLMRSSQPDAAGRAAAELGEWLDAGGDAAGAANAYRHAIDTGSAEWSGKAAVSLGNLLDREGDEDGALQAYMKAVSTGVAEVVGWGTLGIGTLLDRRGDREGAAAAYRQALALADQDLAPLAALHLADALLESGSREEAESIYRRLAARTESDLWETATIRLAEILLERGEREEARTLLEQMAQSDSNMAAHAATMLGDLRAQGQDIEGAAAAYRRAVEVDVPGPSAYGALSLGLIQENQGDLEGATSSYGRALALGAQPHADWALNNLGVLAERLHDDDLAERLYRRAMESEEADVSCRAAFNLGVMQRARGLTDGARESLQRAVETGGADADNARRELEALSNAT